MANIPSDQLLQMETTCGSLLCELQMIWDEVGESDADRDKTLFELEQECLEVYRRKVDQANRSRAQLRQAIADSEAEHASICSTMGEPPVHIKQSNQNPGSLKELLKVIIPQMEDMRKRKSERRNQFLEVQEKIRKVSNEIWPDDHRSSKLAIDDSDLSTKRLEELQKQLQSLQKEKSERLRQELENLSVLNSLCLVLGVDFRQTIMEVHPSLDGNEGSKSISNDTIQMLVSAIQTLRELKIQRMQKLQDLASSLLELWNLMDTPTEEQQLFQNVTSNIAASEHEITEANTLSVDNINHVETEVLRLEELKASKMKELVFKKKTELEELRRRTHLIAEADRELESAMESGVVDPSLILEQIEAQISAIKEEGFGRKEILERVEKWLTACDEESWLEEYNRPKSGPRSVPISKRDHSMILEHIKAHISAIEEEGFSRKEILERVEKWLTACDEESWLEEYNRDDTRYSAGRGAHLTLKRAEKARALVNKIPAMVDALSSKIMAWENERGIEFTYDGVCLLSMLEEYANVRQEKEQERKRQRDQKKLQDQLIAEQEALFGSKPSPSKPQSAKKMPRTSIGGSNRRLSLGSGAIMLPLTPDLMHSKPLHSAKKPEDRSMLNHGSRGVDIAGLPMRKLSFNPTNTREVESPRKPFAPITPPDNITQTPPSQPIFIEAEENATPKKAMATPTPKTPISVPVPMHISATPAPNGVANDTTTNVRECSFEEKRLAYYLSRSD